MLPLTDAEKALYTNEKLCSICEKEFCIDKKGENYKHHFKVRDHCHFNGKYRGAAHSICNIKYKLPKFIPAVYHNGSRYDNHLIIRQISKDCNGYFKCTGKNTEKYITFSMHVVKKDTSINKKRPETYSFRFIDSYRFMGSGLENLVKNLAELHKNLPDNVLKERFYNTYRLCGGNMEKLKLLSRKGVYPYEYMDSWDKFSLPVQVKKEYYYAELNDFNIDDSDIEHVKNICSTLNINSLGEYHDLYVQSDTTLLADVFENFKNNCINIDKLDPAYYLSAPALS